jgi:hypothetical protein
MTTKLLTISILLGLIVSIFMAGCSEPYGNDIASPNSSTISTIVTTVVTPPTESPTTTLSWSELREKVAIGSEIAESLIGLIEQNDVWLTVPPQNGEMVRLLSQNEKDKVLRIATAFEPVKEAQSNPEVTSVDPRDYFWKSYSYADAVTVSNAYLEAQGISQKLTEYMGDQNYPGVFLLFHTQYDNYAYAAMNLVVDMKQEKVIYIEGFVTTPQLPPEDPDYDTEGFMYFYLANLLNPLNPNYDLSDRYGPEGSRFGPPWDRGPGPTFSPTTS